MCDYVVGGGGDRKRKVDVRCELSRNTSDTPMEISNYVLNEDYCL